MKAMYYALKREITAANCRERQAGDPKLLGFDMRDATWVLVRGYC